MEAVWIICRCKDCEYYEPDTHYGKQLNFGYCYYWNYESGMSPNGVDEDDFCSYAVRKEK